MFNLLEKSSNRSPKISCANGHVTFWVGTRKTGVLKNLSKFTGKHLCQNFIFNKIVGLRLLQIYLKSPGHRVRTFLVNFLKFLRTPFL